MFPLGSFAERDGLTVNVDGLVQTLQRNPDIGPDNLPVAIEVLEEILGELDAGYAWRGRAGVVAAIQGQAKFAKVDFPAATAAAGVGAGA